MEVFNHNLKSLFEQLGLASDNDAIINFINQHPLNHNDILIQAHFWTPSQRQFLEEAISQDADWTEQIDTLDILLRK